MNKSVLFVSVVIFMVFHLSVDLYSQNNFTGHVIDYYFDNPSGLYSCDIDQDGDNDILGTAWDQNTIALWLNDGSATVVWTKEIIDNNFTGAAFVFAEDINGDSLTDILGAAWHGNEISYWLNINDTAWIKFVISDSFTQAHEVFAVDLDNDQDIDVLGASAGKNTITWWRNDGGTPIQWTEFTIASDMIGARSVYAVDLNDDGDIDVIGAASTNHDVRWWENSGTTPIFWTEHLIDGLCVGAHMVRACDLNNDSNIDVYGAGYSASNIAGWLNDGGDPIAWQKIQIGQNFPGGLGVCSNDFNGDSFIDIAATSIYLGDVTLWYNDGSSPPVWTEEIVDNNFTNPWPIYSADFNGDGKPDIVSGAGINQVKWWDNNITTGIEKEVFVNTPYLHQNYPNPITSTTTINFTLPVTSKINLSVYNISGCLVKTLINSELQTGFHQVTWNCRDINDIEVNSGVYFYKLISDNNSITKHMLLIR